MTAAEALRRSKALCRELRALPGARDLAPPGFPPLPLLPAFLRPCAPELQEAAE